MGCFLKKLFLIQKLYTYDNCLLIMLITLSRNSYQFENLVINELSLASLNTNKLFYTILPILDDELSTYQQSAVFG